jgi:hypothetical protein
LATFPSALTGSLANLEVVRKFWAEYESGGPPAGFRWLLAHSHEGVELSMQIAGVPPVTVRGHDEVRARLPGSPLGLLGAKLYKLREDGEHVIASAWVRVGDNGGYLDAQVTWRFEFRDGLLSRVRTLPFAPR